MNRSMRRLAIVTIALFLSTASLAGCQRERPAAPEGAWTVTPPSSGATIPPGTTQVPTNATVVSVGTLAPAGTVIGTPLATIVLATPTAAPVIQPTGPTFGYVVKSGDTLFSIALAYNTDVETIRRLNSLPDDTIQVGQVLIVPGTGEGGQQPGETPGAPQATPTPGFVYTVQAGDSLIAIGEQFGVAWQEIAAANDIPAPYTIFRGKKLVIPGVVATPVPTTELKKHVVQSGDTIGSIAIQYGVTVQAILQANQIANPDLIRVGQELIIP